MTNKYKVLITTSGVGQRLGEFTKYTNKALVRIGKKPAISYIIEAYPENVPLVITLGYYGRHVKDFISLAYPQRPIEFVLVDKYQGEGSSLGYSMLQARTSLQCPFIFHAADTMVMEKIPEPTVNWIGGHKDADPSQYGSWKLIKNRPHFSDKGALEFDYIHMGLNGIKDFSLYWKSLEELHQNNPSDPLLNDCQTIMRMIGKGAPFEIKEFSKWFDISNVVAFHHAKEHLGDRFEIYDKVDESIYIFEGQFVIKFFNDENMVKNRVKRANILKDIVPPIEEVGQNFYKYKYIEGQLYSEVVTPEDFIYFLSWAKNNLWKESNAVSDDTLKKICLDFYQTKTIKRLQQFSELNPVPDSEHIINGVKIPKLQDILDNINWDWLAAAKQYRVHGDFIIDNTLKTDGGYCLLDWRQDFGGLLESGDIYYDFAKLNHNLIIERETINKNLFLIKAEGQTVTCDIFRKHNLVECQKVLMDFLEKEGYDIKKVEVLTAIVLLNMAPLHHHPFNLFLYYFGKMQLWKALNQKI